MSAAHGATAPRARAARRPAGVRSPTRPPGARTNRIRTPPPRTRPSGSQPPTPPPPAPRTRASAKSLLHQHFDGANAVAPTNFLPLRARTRIELHRQLVDAVPAPQQPRGDLRLDVEAIGVEPERPRDIGPHDLVAGLPVGDRRAEQHARRAR